MQIAITTDFFVFVFLHSLGRFRPLKITENHLLERPLLVKAVIQTICGHFFSMLLRNPSAEGFREKHINKAL
jgi:hypothetical protein